MGMTAAQPSSPLFGKVYGGVFFWGGTTGFLYRKSGKKNGRKFLTYAPIFFWGGTKWKLLIRFFSVSYDK